jgi:class 3 adenylate cyclase
VALLSVPYRQPGGIAGAVWFEHDGAARGWSPEDSNLAHVVADTIFLRLTAEGRGAGGPPPAPAAGPTPPEGSAETAPGPAPACALKGLEGPMPLRDSLRTPDLRAVEIDALERRLSAQGKSRRDLASDVIDGISVMAIRFTDPVALSLPVPDDGDGSAVAAMACRIETIADEHGIEFVKMLGDLVVCATGFQDAGRPHAQRVSEAALAVQEDLQKAFSSLNTGMAFQIGIDTGSVIGSIVGCAHASYNIWGEAARGAVEMAQTASGGEIQVTEAAYTCLRSGYLFQLKGAYYVDRVGEMNTYLLTGRI